MVTVSAQRPLRVLLIEDNPDHVALLRVMLGMRPEWQVTAASTLGEAVRLIHEQPPNAVLLDLNLPDSQGVETVARVCREAPETAVVVTTNMDEQEAGLASVTAGAEDFLPKGGLRPDVLVRTLSLAIERKASEITLARAAAAMQASRDAIVTVDTEGRVLTWNAGAELVFGRPASEVVARDLADVLPSDAATVVVEEVARVLGGQQPRALEVACHAGDRSLTVALTVSPVLDRAGRMSATVLMARDVTAERRVADALRRSQSRLQAILDNEPECLKIVSLDGTILEMNPAGLEILEADRQDQVVGRKILEFVHPDDHTRVIAAHTAVTLGALQRVEFRTRGLRGAERLLEMIATPLRDGGPRVHSVLSVTRDVTDRRRREEELRESETRYRAMFDASPQPMWLVEHVSRRILDANAAACASYGYRRDEFLSMTLHDIEAEPGSPDEPTARRDAPITVRHRRREGTEILVIVTSTPIQLADRMAEVVVGTDITEQRRLEEQLRQSQKMEALGRLAGAVAHDFNNLIGVITGYTELLHRGMAEGSREARRLAEVSAAAFRAADLTRQLLAFSRHQVLEPRVIDLNQVTREMADMLTRLVGERVQLATVLSAGLGRVRADPGQMGQILMNLAANGRDAMPRGGRLVIETANTELDEAQLGREPDLAPGRYVRLSVTDTGTGMPPDVRARVFEPFFTTKHAGQGTGLGLATVYGIVRQSGGYIEVSSEPERGTSFNVYLPRVDDPLQPRIAQALAPALGGTEAVLLVEDNAALRTMVMELLQAAGYRVLDIADPDQAVALSAAGQLRIDLLITDVVMPRLTGPELARRLRQAQPDLPVLLMSGQTESALPECDALGPSSTFLEKPFTSDLLLRKVRQILDDRPS